MGRQDEHEPRHGFGWRSLARSRGVRSRQSTRAVAGTPGICKGTWRENVLMPDNRATLLREQQLDACEALRAGAKRAIDENAKLGGFEQFRNL